MKTPRWTVAILSHRPEFYPQARQSVLDQTVWGSGEVEIVGKECPLYWPDKIASLLRAASGEFFTLLPDDDQLAPTFGERHLWAMDEYKADLVYADVEIFGPRVARLGGLKPQIELPDFDPEVVRMHTVPWATFMVKTDLLRSCNDGNGYDGTQPLFDWDVDLALVQKLPRWYHLKKEFLYRFGDHQQNGSRIMSQDGEMGHKDAIAQLRRKWSDVIRAGPHLG